MLLKQLKLKKWESHHKKLAAAQSTRSQRQGCCCLVLSALDVMLSSRTWKFFEVHCATTEVVCSGGDSALLTGAFLGNVVVVSLCSLWWLCFSLQKFCLFSFGHASSALRRNSHGITRQKVGQLNAVKVSLNGSQLLASMSKHDPPEHYLPETVCMACRRPRWGEPSQGVTLSRHWQGLVSFQVVCGLFWLNQKHISWIDSQISQFSPKSIHMGTNMHFLSQIRH